MIDINLHDILIAIGSGLVLQILILLFKNTFSPLKRFIYKGSIESRKLNWLGYLLYLFLWMLIVTGAYGIYHFYTDKVIGKDRTPHNWKPLESDETNGKIGLRFSYNFEISYLIHDESLIDVLSDISKNDGFLIKQVLIKSNYYSYLRDVEIKLTFFDSNNKERLTKFFQLAELSSKEQYSFNPQSKRLSVFYLNNDLDREANSKYRGNIQSLDEINRLKVSFNILNTLVVQLEPRLCDRMFLEILNKDKIFRGEVDLKRYSQDIISKKKPFVLVHDYYSEPNSIFTTSQIH